MNQEDLQLFAMLARLVIDVTELQAMMSKMFTARFQNMEIAQDMREKISGLPQGEEATALRSKFENLMAELAEKNILNDQKLEELVARGEALCDQMRAALTRVMPQG